MDKFLVNPGTINLLALSMLAGIVVLMLIVNSYTLSFDKDKLLSSYNIYLLCCIVFIGWSFYKLADSGQLSSLYVTNAADVLVITIPGTGYILFFGFVFNLGNAGKLMRTIWYTALVTMLVQFIYVLGMLLTGNDKQLSTVPSAIIFVVITATTLVMLIYAFRLRQKTLFQKNILLGGTIFYILVLISNVQEQQSLQGVMPGISFMLIAFLIEHLFFAVASISRMRHLYSDAERNKLAVYRQQLKTEQVINYFAQSLAVKSSVDDLLWDITRNCISRLGFEDCVIYLCNDDHKYLVQKAAWGPKTTEENKILNPMNIPLGYGIVGTVALNNKAEIINDTTKDKRYIVDDASRLSEISVPVSIGDKVYGVIDSESSQKDFYNEGHLQVLTTIASLLADRISKIQAEEAAREKEMEILRLKASNYQYQLEVERIVNFFATAISSHHSIDELLWDVAGNLIGKLGFEDCMIYLWNEDKTLLLQKAGFGIKGSMQEELDKNIYHVPKGKGLVGYAVDKKEILLINDTSADARYFSADNKIRLSELCVPILQNGEAIGAINTEHTEKDFYTDRHLQILTTIASMLADKIEKIETLQQSQAKEMEVLRLNRDLATSQLTTLRAQMNPHFIFNALNSVQQFILAGDITEANRYLSKFAKLQRQVLNHSDQNFIQLEKELEVLNLYLELEQLRFERGFTYAIEVAEEIDDDEIKIPPMIIQPFVENAIWHGLMPRQGERWVRIKFEMNGDDMLQCTITDNGIGRIAAARLKGENDTQHKSKGLSLVYDRLNILSQQYGQAFAATINDLVDENNVAQGTEVQLQIYIG